MQIRPLRVALFTDAYLTEDGEIVDGVANTLSRFAEHCRQRIRDDLRLTVVTHATGDDSRHDLGSVEVLRYRPLRPLTVHPGWSMDHIPVRPRVLHEVGAGQPDLLHIASPGSMGLNGLAAARRLGRPMLGSYHTAYEENVRRRVEKTLRARRLPYRALGRFFDRLTWRYVIWFFNHMDRVVAPSNHTRREVAARLRKPVGLFSRGVDTDRFHPGYRCQPAVPTALHVGRLVVDKNLEVLVEIFGRRRDVALVIVGDGPERSWLEQALPHATFTGHLTGDALSVAYASADLFVFPSETETFGNVALEAMASGPPVVTSDAMAPRELVTEGENGFIGTVGTDFHLKVERLIAEPDLRRRMGRQARRFALTRRWESVFEGLIEDYRQVAASRTSRDRDRTGHPSTTIPARPGTQVAGRS
jgi:glycosyltransferase involved in cell wall biosynthesis